MIGVMHLLLCKMGQETDVAGVQFFCWCLTMATGLALGNALLALGICLSMVFFTWRPWHYRTCLALFLVSFHAQAVLTLVFPLYAINGGLGGFRLDERFPIMSLSATGACLFNLYLQWRLIRAFRTRFNRQSFVVLADQLA